MAGVKLLVGPHDCHQIFRLTQIDNVVGIARQHMDGLNPVAADFKFDFFIGADLAFLNQPVSGHDHKELPLAVVPVLPLGDTWLCDVHGDLTAVPRFQQFCKAAALVHIHLQRERNFFRRQIGEIGAVELFRKAYADRMLVIVNITAITKGISPTLFKISSHRLCTHSP